jgi:predicted GTPase
LGARCPANWRKTCSENQSSGLLRTGYFRLQRFAKVRTSASRIPIVILRAAGRDFHNFNVCYRNDPNVVVVAFTASQIPGIADRPYPGSLAGPLYPEGIPNEPEDRSRRFAFREAVARVVFAYSDVPHAHVMHLASRALAVGADFVPLGPRSTMLEAHIPVIAVCAVRTGFGKSQIARWLGRHLRERGLRAAVVRHPMPYGRLERQRTQRFAAREDFERRWKAPWSPASARLRVRPPAVRARRSLLSDPARQRISLLCAPR